MQCRNNTNFPLAVVEFFRNAKFEAKYDFLKYYQNVARIYMHDARGLLIMHQMGFGKSILAVAVAMDLITNWSVIIILTKSLQDNMRSSIHKYVKLRTTSEPDYHLGRLSQADLDDWIDRHFSFVALNASNMARQLGDAAVHGPHTKASKSAAEALEARLGEINRIPLRNKCVIVDEAHNLFRMITNGSKNGQAFYNAVMGERHMKLLFLTGTLFTNDVFECVPCFNMLAGSPILPEDYREFHKLYVDKANSRLRNRNFFQNRIFGLVSYISTTSTPGKALGAPSDKNTAEFPDELPVVVEYVNMTADQYVAYQLARDREKEEGGKGGPSAAPAAMTKPKSKSASTYRVKSRQLSNFFPRGATSVDDVTDFSSPKFEAIVANIAKHPDTIGLVYSQFTTLGGLGVFSRYLESIGWERVDMSMEVIGASDGPGDGPVMPSATEYLGRLYGKLGAADDAAPAAPAKPRFAIISGEVKVETRAAIAARLTAFSNRHGADIALILVSSTGAEGLDLKFLRHIHIMEPYWNWARCAQVIARGVRNNSHVDLDAAEKNVQPYIYLAVPPRDEMNTDGTYPATTDTDLYNEAVAGEVILRDASSAVAETSIECEINAGHCRVCSPTNQPLFTDNPAKDAARSDPCQPYQPKNITAESIVVDGVEYYFIEDSTALFDYRVYEKSPDVAGYKPVIESDKRFEAILAAILNLVKSK